MPPNRAVPVAAFGVPVLVVVASWIAWFADGFTAADSVDSYLLTNSALAVSFAAFGALVLTHRPRHRIGLLFVAFAAFYAVSVGCLGIRSAFELPPAWDRAVDLLGITIWIPAIAVCLPLILQLFPDGTPLSPRWRPLITVTAALLVLTPILTFAPGAITNEPILDRSPVLPEAAGRIVGRLVPVFIVLAALVLVTSVVALLMRAVRSHGTQRLQVMWLLCAVLVFVVLNAQRIFTSDGPIIFLLTLPLIPGAAAVAIIAHQLYGIRLMINRSIVYVLLTLGVVGAYLGLVAVTRALASDRLALTPLLATALIAVAFAPVRSRLQSVVDRVMYGQRADPAEAAARVGQRLGSGLDRVLQALCESLRLPYAAVLSGSGVVAAHGKAPTLQRTIPLEVVDGPAADLAVGLRAGESQLSRADQHALELLASPVGLALQAVRLADQLRESRTHIVATREEERRRLRRDLHDGLGSALTAVSFKADAASNLQQSDPARTGGLLLEIRADLTAAIADIRRLVYGLRPPDLDELGLEAALRQRAEQSWRRDPGFVVTVDVPADLPQLPAAVEVAAYRIATEAVTNASLHSRASACRVSLRTEGGLHIDIGDNGSTSMADWPHGVGLRSMSERAAELGGTFSAGPTSTGGCVHALLPLDPP